MLIVFRFVFNDSEELLGFFLSVFSLWIALGWGYRVIVAAC